MSDLARNLAALPDAHLIAEMQAALDSLTPVDLASLPTPGLTPFLGTPCGDIDPEPHPHCPTCSHDLELDADIRCVRCGAQS